MNGTLDLRRSHFPALPVFVALTAAIVAGGMIALDRSAGAAVVVTAVTIDIVLVVPLLHYLLVVRGRALPVISVLAVFRLALAGAALVLPAGDRALYDLLAHLARPAELVMAGFVLFRLSLGWRALRAAPTADILERYRSGVRAALPGTVPSADRASDAIAFEAAVVWFATRSWRSRPESPRGSTSFSGYRTSGHTGLMVGLLMIVLVEVVVVHLLVSLWSPPIAWILTVLGLYGAVWVLGDLQAVRLRPSWMDGDRLCMRLGLRWSLTVPLGQVRRARRLEPNERVPDSLGLALPNSRRMLIELSSPATAVGIYGMRRTVEAIELGVDDPDAFIRSLERTP